MNLTRGAKYPWAKDCVPIGGRGRSLCEQGWRKMHPKGYRTMHITLSRLANEAFSEASMCVAKVAK